MVYWIVYASIIVASLGLGILYQQFLGWRSKEFGFQVSFGLITPMCYSIASLILLSIYAFNVEYKSTLTMIVFGVPSVVYFSYFMIRSMYLSKYFEKEEKLKKENQKKVHEWIKQFTFLHQRDVNISTYLIDEGYTGNIYIACENKEQQAQIEAQKHNLPGKIFVKTQIRSDEETANLKLYRLWIQQFSFLGEKDIHDQVYYNDKQGLHGRLYLFVPQEHVEEVKKQRFQLPKEIELVLCHERQKFGLLINLGSAVVPSSPNIYTKLV